MEVIKINMFTFIVDFCPAADVLNVADLSLGVNAF